VHFKIVFILKILDQFEGTAATLPGTAMPTLACPAPLDVVSSLQAAMKAKINSETIFFIIFSFHTQIF
jgi:hypothetical protein